MGMEIEVRCECPNCGHSFYKYVEVEAGDIGMDEKMDWRD